MASEELCWVPAVELERRIRARALSPVELLETILARIERVNPAINAWVTVAADQARDEARRCEAEAQRGEWRGPLHGIPLSIKDLNATKGIRTTYGSKFTEHEVPDFDCTPAEYLKKAGAIVLGKTNTPQTGHRDMTDNLVFGITRNPWKLDRTSGGSSGGAGAACAAGLGPLHFGTDGAGSIRIPSCYCGIFGLKPSFARVPMWPSADIWAATSHGGPMTRTVSDAAVMLSAMAQPDERDPFSLGFQPQDFLAQLDSDLKGLRVAFSVDFGYAAVHPEVRAAVTAAARRFQDLGCRYEEVVPGWKNPADFFSILYDTAQANRVGDKYDQRPDWIEPSLKAMVEHGRRVSMAQLAWAQGRRNELFHEIREFFRNYDLLLTPTLPMPAFDAVNTPEEIEGRPTHGELEPRVPFTYPFNYTGQPAATVPCGFSSDGLPLGLQIVGHWHADALVLRAARCFEQIAPWADRRPPL